MIAFLLLTLALFCFGGMWAQYEIERMVSGKERKWRDIFWWPNPFTYKGGLRAWVRDCVSMYWRDFRKWLRQKKCGLLAGHDYQPHVWPVHGWAGSRDAKSCIKCGRFE